MPINACANDNWIGRERAHRDPAVQEKALTGNTIFFAQPTADVPGMELPPPLDALVDSLNVLFS